MFTYNIPIGLLLFWKIFHSFSDLAETQSYNKNIICQSYRCPQIFRAQILLFDDAQCFIQSVLRVVVLLHFHSLLFLTRKKSSVVFLKIGSCFLLKTGCLQASSPSRPHVTRTTRLLNRSHGPTEQAGLYWKWKFPQKQLCGMNCVWNNGLESCFCVAAGS